MYKLKAAMKGDRFYCSPVIFVNEIYKHLWSDDYYFQLTDKYKRQEKNQL